MWDANVSPLYCLDCSQVIVAKSCYLAMRVMLNERAHGRGYSLGNVEVHLSPRYCRQGKGVCPGMQGLYYRYLVGWGGVRCELDLFVCGYASLQDTFICFSFAK